MALILLHYKIQQHNTNKSSQLLILVVFERHQNHFYLDLLPSYVSINAMNDLLTDGGESQNLVLT